MVSAQFKSRNIIMAISGVKGPNHVSTREVDNIKKEIKATLNGVKTIKNLSGDQLLSMKKFGKALEVLSKRDNAMSKKKSNLIKATMKKYTDGVDKEINSRNNNPNLGKKPKQNPYYHEDKFVARYWNDSHKLASKIK